MKIRTFADDFLVEEKLDFNIKPDGKYLLLSFTKKDWSTFDLISSISTRFKIPKNEINIAGIKDRHAITTSYMTIKKSLSSHLIESIKNRISIIPNVEFNILGFLNDKIKSENIIHNKFTIVVRSIFENEIPEILSRFMIVKKNGVPNYYDDQRFGSARHQKGFVAKSIFLKDYENAMRLIFETSKYDKKSVKIAKSNFLSFLKKDIKELDYDFLSKNLPFELKSLFNAFYKDGKEFYDSLKSIDRRFLILLFHSYQSYLFNLLLSEIILDYIRESSFFSLKGEVNNYIFPDTSNLDNIAFLQELYLPIPSYKTYKDIEKPETFFLEKSSNYEDKFDIKISVKKALEKVENIEKIRLEQINAKDFNINLKSERRKAFLFPKNLIISDFEDDDFFKGKKKARLEFSLEKGSYATMVIKGIFLQGKYGKAKKLSNI